MSLRSHTIRVRGTTSELARVRREVAAWAEAAGLDESPARRLQLAVDETVANAIEHGMEDAASGRITVRGTPGRGRLTVAVRYKGDRFDPTTAPTPSASEVVRAHAKHGYGLHLIRTLVDAVASHWDRGATAVRLTPGGAARRV
ncbi:MAG: ATP-binding protein [Bacteroidota bacterium]